MSAEILTFRRPRTLAIVLAELMLQQGKIDRLNRSGRHLTDGEDRAYAALENECLALRAEAKAMLETQTGVTWDALAGAVL